MQCQTPQRKRNSPERYTPATDSLIVVQVILSAWDKAYRGGEGATIRNRVPEALELPLSVQSMAEPSYIVHRSKHGFGDAPVYCRLRGEPLEIAPTANKPFTCDCISAGLIKDRLHVDYTWSCAGGAPRRNSRRNVLVLERGQWGRVLYNGRHPTISTGEWWYEKWVFNIGFFAELDPRVFLDTVPVKVHSAMDLLW
jgi:hypothetical protein